MIKSSLLCWVVRLFDGEYKYWKIIPLRKLESIGGIECIQEHFDVKCLPHNILWRADTDKNTYLEIYTIYRESIQHILGNIHHYRT
jgi:hypothetical protein